MNTMIKYANLGMWQEDSDVVVNVLTEWTDEDGDRYRLATLTNQYETYLYKFLLTDYRGNTEWRINEQVGHCWTKNHGGEPDIQPNGSVSCDDCGSPVDTRVRFNGPTTGPTLLFECAACGWSTSAQYVGEQ